MDRLRTVGNRLAAADHLFDGGLTAAMHDLEASVVTAWAIDRIEELLSTSQILTRQAFGPAMDFVVLQGGDSYFVKKFVALAFHTEGRY